MDVSQVDDMIGADPVVMFSKSWCPYCHKAKALFKIRKVPFKVYELDNMANGSDIQATLKTKTNQSTVPNIFIGTKHVGGSDDLAKADKNGTLKTYLADAGITV